MRSLSPLPPPAAAALDVLCVVAFVAIGRASHDEGSALIGFATTAWPFVTALAAGWLVARAWRAPSRVVAAGLPVWAITVAGGMGLRVLTGGGTEISFTIVTAVFLAVTLLGWRAVASLLAR